MEDDAKARDLEDRTFQFAESMRTFVKQLLKESGLALIAADNLADAAQKAVGAASSKSQVPNPK